MFKVECERTDCSIMYHGSSTTLLGWSPTYDKNGVPTNHNPNILTSAYSCSKCGRTWVMAEQEDRHEVIETTELQMRYS